MLTRRKLKFLLTIGFCVFCVFQLSQQIVYQMVRDSAVYLRTKQLMEAEKEAKVPGLHADKIQDIYESGFDWGRSEICPNRGSNLNLLIFVMSPPENSRNRLAIRRTWGAFGGMFEDVSVAFLVGSSLNYTVEDIVGSESEQFDDLVLAKFIDNFQNSTLKSVAMLEWVEKKCFGAKFVLKVNDDVFLNVPRLLEFIEKKKNEHRTIFGRLIFSAYPDRNASSKDYVKMTEYDSHLYPFHMAKHAYLLTGDTIHDIFERSLSTPFFKLENIFITGFVGRELLKLKMQNVQEFNDFLGFEYRKYRCFIKTRVISIPNCTALDLFAFWQKTFHYENVDCSVNKF